MDPRFLAQDEPEADDAEGKKALQQQHVTAKCNSFQEARAKAVKSMLEKLGGPRGVNDCQVIPGEQLCHQRQK